MVGASRVLLIGILVSAVSLGRLAGAPIARAAPNPAPRPQAVPAAAAPLAPTPSAGESAQAREHFSRGQVHYDLKEYGLALEQFKSSYRYVQDPVMLYNIAQCHYFLGQGNEALGFYRNYLRRSPDAKNKAAVERKIAELERQQASAKPGTGAVPPAPLIGAGTPAKPSSPATLSPPPATASSPSVVSRPGAVAASPVRPVATPSASTANSAIAPAPIAVTPATTSRPSPSLDLTAPPSPPDSSGDSPFYKRWWFWTGVGAVVVAGAVGAFAVARRGQVGDCMGVSPCLKVGGQ